MYDQEMSTQAGIFNKTIIARLTHYVAKDQKGRDIYVLMLKYANNTEVLKSTNLLQSSLILSCHLPEPTSFENCTGFPTEKTATTVSHELKAIAP